MASNPARRIRRQMTIFGGIVLLLATGVFVGIPVVRHFANGRGGRTKTTERLHQIGLAMILYQHDHHDALPDSLEELLRAENLV
jgi:hypothetical protein